MLRITVGAGCLPPFRSTGVVGTVWRCRPAKCASRRGVHMWLTEEVHQMRNILLSAIAAALLAACQSTPEAPAPAEEVKPSPPPATAPAPRTEPSTAPVQRPAMSGNPLKDPSNILSKRSVYFDFDS